MRKFLEVYPNELLGIPLKREIDFGIDLILHIGPILFPPYQMATTELNDLKSQPSSIY